ncbi:hypothetical protein RsTz2092_01720 [Deferribacterales bacterium RsTz2092]|nr:hypothetical protein AGMMS49941_00170 [Deferribacterales bacterium]
MQRHYNTHTHTHTQQEPCQSERRQRLTNALIYAAVFAVIFVPLAMLTTYWQFSDSFKATYFMVLTHKISFAIELFVGFSVLFFISKTKKTAFAVISAICLLQLLEGGLLSLGLPELDGNTAAYNSLPRKVLDSLLWLSVIATFVLCRDKIYKNSKYMLLGLSIYAVVCTADAYRSTLNKSNNFDIGNVQCEALWKQLTLNEQNNVLMLLLDATSAEVVKDVFGEHPELAAKYNGFINFTNNLMTGGGTTEAIPSIMTGLYYDTPQLAEHINRIVNADSSLLNYFDKRKYKVVFSSMIGVCLQNIGELQQEEPSLHTHGFMRIRIDRIARLMRAPYIFKRQILIDAPSTGRGHWSFDNVSYVYPQDSRLDMTRHYLEVNAVSDIPTFQYVHFMGGHSPLIANDDCSADMKRHKDGNYSNYYTQVYCSLKGTADILQVLKDKGVYDNSTLVLLGDHGSINKPNRTQKLGDFYSSPVTPFLMLKPRGNKSPLRNDRTPTSNIMVNTFLKKYADSGYSMAERDIVKLLHQDVRKTVTRDEHSHSFESSFVDTNYKLLNSQKTIFDRTAWAASLKPVRANYRYVLTRLTEVPDLMYDSEIYWTAYNIKDNSTLTFRVPKKEEYYTLTIEIGLSHIPNSAETPSGLSLSAFAGDYSVSKAYPASPKDIVLTIPVRSDNTGLVNVRLSNDTNRLMYLSTMELEY